MTDERDSFAYTGDEDQAEWDLFVANIRDIGDDEVTQRDVRIDWLLGKLAKRRKQIARNNAVADARKLDIEDWRQGENGKIERSLSWIEYQIRELVPPDGKTFAETYGAKSRSLPTGTIGYRQRPSRIQILDDGRTLAWAKTHGVETTVVTTETVAKAALKKALAIFDDPDGFEIIKGLDEFYVTTDEPKKGQG